MNRMRRKAANRLWCVLRDRYRPRTQIDRDDLGLRRTILDGEGLATGPAARHQHSAWRESRGLWSPKGVQPDGRRYPPLVVGAECIRLWIRELIVPRP